MSPISTNNRIENYVHSLKVEAAKLQPLETTFQNLSLQQRRALGDLSGNRDLVIKKADKGSTIVVMDREDYVAKGLKHLSDQETYRKLNEDTTKEVSVKVVSLVRTMYQDGIIDHRTAEYLLPPNPVRTQEMYFLTKLHKNPYSERPIVSGCNGPTEKVSA